MGSSGPLLSKESPTEGVSPWPWSKRHRLGMSLGRSPGAVAGSPLGTSLPRAASSRKTEGENPTHVNTPGREGGTPVVKGIESPAPPDVDPPRIPVEVVGGGLEGLDPPEAKVKRVVQLMVRGEWAEEANGYILLTMVALAVGSFGGDLTILSFWLINAVALLEVALKLMRNWSDTFVGVKCCDVASQWDAFWGLKWSIRTRALAVVVQLGLYGAEMRNALYSGPNANTKLDQVEKVIAAFLVLHWVLGMWVLLMELNLFMKSKISLLLLVPGFGARRFVEVMTALGLWFMSCVSGVMWEACRVGRWGDMADLFDWVSDMGQNPFGIEGLSALTWYVHSRRHPMLRGYAAEQSGDCGLDVDWTLDFKELIDLFWRCHQGMIRVSPSAQKWALDGIQKYVKKWASTLSTRCVERHGKVVKVESIGLDGLILLDAVLVIPEGQEKILKALSATVAKLLVDKGVVKRSLNATVDLACAGSSRQKEFNGRAMERLAQRLMMLGEKLEDVQRWEMALALHEASLKLRNESKGAAKGRARSLSCIAWTMANINVNQGLEPALAYARDAVRVGQRGFVGDWDMAMHLATLAYVLTRMGCTDEAHEVREKAEDLWKRSTEHEKRMKEKSEKRMEEKSEYGLWPKSKKRLVLRRALKKFVSKRTTEVDIPTKNSS